MRVGVGGFKFKAHRGIDVTRARCRTMHVHTSIEKMQKGSPERQRAAQSTVEYVEPDESTTIRLVIAPDLVRSVLWVG